MKLAITLPNGKRVGADAYVRAWKLLKTLPPAEPVRGWTWWAESAQAVLRDIAHGCQDRINRHDRTMRTCSERRLYTKVRKAARLGQIKYECKGCGATLEWLRVNPNNPQSRYCSPECRGW